MAFHITHRYGEMTGDAPLSALPALLEELKERPEDEEHCAVAVTHESEWCLGVQAGGYVAGESLERGEPRHMLNVPEAKILTLWEALAKGDLEVIEREPWLPGY
jgi:hypothetical protein